MEGAGLPDLRLLTAAPKGVAHVGGASYAPNLFWTRTRLR